MEDMDINLVEEVVLQILELVAPMVEEEVHGEVEEDAVQMKVAEGLLEEAVNMEAEEEVVLVIDLMVFIVPHLLLVALAANMEGVEEAAADLL